jgi:hypothetical protein
LVFLRFGTTSGTTNGIVRGGAQGPKVASGQQITLPTGGCADQVVRRARRASSLDLTDDEAAALAKYLHQNKSERLKSDI